MSTENDNTLRLHHSIKDGNQQPAPNAASDDFAAGFRDDEPPVEQAEETEQAGEQQAGAEGGEQSSSQGVDTPENGSQGSTQAQDVALEGLPDDVRQQVESIIEARNRAVEEAAQARRDRDSMVGRVAPVQRELDAAKQQLARLQQHAAPQQQPQPQGASAPPTALSQVQAQFETPEFKEYERLYPEDAAIQKRNQLAIAQAADAQAQAMAERIAQLDSVMRGTFERVDRIEQERMTATKRAELEELSKAHPDWQQINESEEFWSWFNERGTLFGFRDESDMRTRLNDRSFVSNVLDLYKLGRGTQQQAPQGQAAPASQPNPVLALAAAPRNTGGGIHRPRGGAGSAADEFMAGFNDPT